MSQHGENANSFVYLSLFTPNFLTLYSILNKMLSLDRNDKDNIEDQVVHISLILTTGKGSADIS